MDYKGITYTKWFDNMTDEVVSVLAEGKFPTNDKERWDSLRKAIRSDRVIAMIEFPYMDIELEMYAPWSDWHEATDDNNEILLDYFVCIKHGDGEWESDDIALTEVSVDFSKADWESALVKEMCEALGKHAKDNGFSLDKPND